MILFIVLKLSVDSEAKLALQAGSLGSIFRESSYKVSSSIMSVLSSK